MNLSKSQLTTIVFLVDHYIWYQDKFLQLFEEAQGGVVLAYNKLGDKTVDEIEKTECWSLAEEAEKILNSKIENWIYNKFYLRQFKEYMLNLVREAKRGVKNATSS